MANNFGRYEVLSCIASGGMAKVYRARVSGAGGFERIVAIKAMLPRVSADPEFVSMFLDEARIAARIQHPNVVATHDIQQTDDQLFLVMDFVDGPTLKQVHSFLKHPLPLPIALRVHIDALAGLHTAHELEDKDGKPLNLVHRDATPHNILVGRDGVTKIGDFGVVMAESRLANTRDGIVKGKLAYFSPEQVIGNDIDRRADIFAFGVGLWESLAGRKMHAGLKLEEVARKVHAGEVPSLVSINPEVPTQIADVIGVALKRDLDERYRSALAFSAALEEAAGEMGVSIATTRQLAEFLAASGVLDRYDRAVERFSRKNPVGQPNVAQETAPVSQSEPISTWGTRSTDRSNVSPVSRPPASGGPPSSTSPRSTPLGNGWGNLAQPVGAPLTVAGQQILPVDARQQLLPIDAQQQHWDAATPPASAVQGAPEVVPAVGELAGDITDFEAVGPTSDSTDHPLAPSSENPTAARTKKPTSPWLGALMLAVLVLAVFGVGSQFLQGSGAAEPTVLNAADNTNDPTSAAPPESSHENARTVAEPTEIAAAGDPSSQADSNEPPHTLSGENGGNQTDAGTTADAAKVTPAKEARSPARRRPRYTRSRTRRTSKPKAPSAAKSKSSGGGQEASEREVKAPSSSKSLRDYHPTDL